MPPKEASSSSKANPKAASRAQIPPLKDLKVSKAILYYTVQDGVIEDWTLLECAGPTRTHNVGQVTFFGDVQIIQKRPDSATQCVLTLEKNGFLPRPFRRERDTTHGVTSIVGEFVCERVPRIEFLGDAPADNNDYPLAKIGMTHYSAFLKLLIYIFAFIVPQVKAIRLVLAADSTEWKTTSGKVSNKVELLIGQLAQLMTGRSSANPETIWGRLIRGDTLVC